FGETDGSDPDRPEKDPGYVIVGVVQDAKYNNLRRDIDPTMYAPLTGHNATFEVRTAGDPRTLVPALRNLVGQHNSNLPMTNVLTETEQIDRLLDQERLMAKLSSFFGILSLLLACVGLYGLLSYEVTRRTREIGIRMALGAQRADLIRMVVAQGIALVVTGMVIGTSAALAIGRLLTKLLYGVKPSDPVTLITVTLLLIIVAIVAASVPARRATTVDPMIALRCE
ncbi:MAG TPA: FtsX-like permease family protein, partial [Candidatus Angelobacter sp.]|nr:FtsX-like permease family protein [Candidatus Angelobacter sp.]